MQCALYNYGCPENFRDSLTAPTATFPKILWAFVPMVGLPSERALVSSYWPSIHYITALDRLPEILDCSFQWDCEPRILGKGWPWGKVGDGTIRKSVGEFL